MKNLLLMSDAYKLSHYKQYPPRTEYVHSYIEARKDNSGMNINKTLFLETMQNFMELLYQDLDKKESKVNNFVGLHDNIIVALIAFFTLIVTILGLCK